MQNSIYKIKYLLFLSWDWEALCLTVWGGNPPPPKETLLEIRGGNVFIAYGAKQLNSPLASPACRTMQSRRGRRNS